MKTLLIGLSVRALAESAVHSGYPVIALDSFGDQDLKALTESYSLHHDLHTLYNPQALYQASRRLVFDTVAYTSSMENHPDILGRFARSHKIIGNPACVVRSVRSWKALFARIKRAGFPVPETIFPGAYRETDSGRRWLIKPMLSGGGHGINFLQRETLPGRRLMLQEYIHGKSCSASFVANGHECTVVGITEQLIGVRELGSFDFRYCGNLLPLPEVLDPDSGKVILERVRSLAAFVTREYGLTGVNGMDFILNDNQVWLMEVNPRYSASMELIERAYGLPVFHLHVQAAAERRLPVFNLETFLKGGDFFGKAILFAENDAIAPDTQSWWNRAIRDIPVSGEKLRRGYPICTILASRPTYAGTFNELVNQAGILKEEIYG